MGGNYKRLKMGHLSQEHKVFSSINYKWLPIKAHYFLMYGVSAGVTNFFPVIGKSIGLDTTAVGITFTVLPLCVFFIQPLFGFFADYIQNIKLLVISLITAKVLLSVFILLLKPVEEGNQNIFYTHQFWIYMLLIVISCCCLYVASCLTDVSCYEILGEQKEYYGRQRLFGTAGTGIFTLLTGYVNDLISNEYGHTKYFAGFYLMFVLYFLDMLVLIRIDLPKAKMSTSIVSDIKNLCKVKEFITFCVSIFVIGNLAGLQSNFLFWYLTDLGANQTLLGLTIAVQCLVAEIPFFFFSGWFVKNLGYFNCLTCSFVGFTISFGLYSLLKNPWLVLPIETLHGLTFAVFFASTTAFASAYAPPGTEAFVLGLLCGIYQGLGISVGSFLGGLSFKEFGGSRTFLIASCLSTLCIPATFIFNYFFKREKYKKLMTFDNEAVAAGVTPFFPVIGKSIGLDTTAVGITYTILPISAFIFKPLFGFLADYIQNIKLLVISLITAKVVLSVFILLLKPIEEGNQNIFYTHQFWIYMLLIVISCCCLYVASCLTDVSCYEILGEQKEYYGRQRLFGTASTGIITLFTGYLNDLISNEYGHAKYFAGFYLMFTLYFLNMVVLFRMDLPKAKMSTSIVSDIKNSCKTKEFITFCVSIFVIGNLAGLQANFLFWYLTDLGASQTLLGLTIAVQCLVAEIPFFFFSGWFIKNLGYFNCLTCSFVGFTIRFGLYYLLKNPWLILPIETLHGLTFAVFYASTTAFASAYAPPGTEAFVLGLLCGIYQGLGVSVGSFLGGLSFKEFGGNRTFLIASCLSALCVPTTFLSNYLFKRKKYEKIMTFDSEAGYKNY